MLQLEDANLLFFWVYGPDTYPNGTAFFFGSPLLSGNADFYFRTFGDIGTVPEPSTFVLEAVTLIGSVLYSRYRGVPSFRVR